MSPSLQFNLGEPFVPHVVVVDPRFEAYKPLAASARQGRLTIHFRSSGVEALKLARHLDVDAWLVAEHLDDMSGHDFVSLLKAGIPTDSRVAVVDAPRVRGRRRSIVDSEARESGADAVLAHPISFNDLENLLGLPSDTRAEMLAEAGLARPFFTLPVGVGAAVIAIAVLMIG